MERIDIHIVVNPSTANIFSVNEQMPERSAQIKERVCKAREIQHQRFRMVKTNSKMTIDEIEEFCKVDEETHQIIKTAMAKFNLSIRQYHKILKVARTIADLTNTQNIQRSHVLESIRYR